MIARSLPASVILATRGRPDLLADTVASILAGDTLPAELIVVDQSDAPDSAFQAAPAPVVYRWTRERGLSRANNLGVREASSDLLVFTHDDVLVERDWLRRLVDALAREGPRTVVTGRVLAAGDRPGGFAPSLQPAGEPALWQGRIGLDVLYPLNMALHRSALEAVEGFDERLGPGTPYPAAEDNDLGHRLLEAGYRIAYAPEAVVRHRAWRPWAEHSRLRYGYGRGQGAFYAKHLDLRDRYMLRRLAGDTAGRLARLPGRVLRKEKRGPAGDLFYVAGVLAGLAGWWRSGHRSRPGVAP
jgi:GT2 family glycosyltransferase